MNSYRSNRVAESIRRELPGLLRSIKDPRVSKLLSVVRVEVSGDLSLAKIFISDINGLETAQTSVVGLRSAGGLLRHEIAMLLGLKKAPALEFIADNSLEHSAKIAEMLKKLHPDQNENE